MLDVFMKSGFPVSSSTDFGTVSVRFPIEPNDDYRAALAARHGRPPAAGVAPDDGASP
jgi:hypothetical protein